MGIRRSCLALAMLLLPAQAGADRHNLEMAASASAATGSPPLWGGSFAVATPVFDNDDPKKPDRWSFVTDVAVNGGPHDGGSVSQISGLVGVRYQYLLRMKKLVLIPKLPDEYHSRLQLFAQVLTGGVRVKNEFPALVANSIQNIEDHETKGALSVGTGVDFLFSEYGGLRGQVDLFRRLDADPPRKHFFRFSVGVVYRFERDH